MISLVLKGIGLGLANSLSPGPLMMLILRDSLRRGPRVGLVVASSSFFADIPLVAFCFLAGSFILQNNATKIIISIGGVLLLLKFARDSLKAPPKENPVATRTSFWNGILATLVNPHPYLFWILVGVPIGREALLAGFSHALSYFLAFQVAFVGTNCAIALLSGYLGKKFSNKFLFATGKVAAAVFVVLALLLASEVAHGAIAPRPFKIALAIPVTGSDSASSQGNLMQIGANAAIRAYQSELAEKGIETGIEPFYYRDTSTDLASVAEKIIASRAAVAFGFTFSDHVLLVARKFQEGKLPLVTPDASADSISKLGHYIHPTVASNSYQALAMVKEAESRSVKQGAVMVVTQDCGYCADLAGDISEHAAKRGKIKILKVIETSSHLIDKNKIKEEFVSLRSRTDVVFLPNFELPSAEIFEALLEVNPKLVFIGGDGWSTYGGQVLRQRLRPETQAFALAHWSPVFKTKKTAIFEKELRGISEESKASAAMAFDGMAFLLQGLLSCPNLDRESIESCLSRLKRFEALTGTAIISTEIGVAKPLVVTKVTPESFAPIKTIKP